GRAPRPLVPRVRQGDLGVRSGRDPAPTARRPEHRGVGAHPSPERRAGAAWRGARATGGRRRARGRGVSAAVSAAGARARWPSLAGWLLTAVAVGFAAWVYLGLGPRPNAPGWWEPTAARARAV